MLIGIDASRAFLKQRTGIEEYSYQVIKHLMNKLDGHEVVLYLRSGQSIVLENCSLRLPENWKVKIVKFPFFWTQFGLSLEMLLHPVDVLFIPAHTVPIIHPKNTIVTIHGLEYEFAPESYSRWARFYMRNSIKKSCQWARTIIAVSNNTKNDLIQLYRIDENKIRVIYEGYNRNFQFPCLPDRQAISNFQSNPNFQNSNLKIGPKFIHRSGQNLKFLLFIGRLEERKNIIGIIRAFEILKEKYKIPHKLILAGKFGYGGEKIREKLRNTSCGKDIILPGFVSEEDKRELLRNADVFLFPTFYEGFGLPVLEAQSVGVPVVCSNVSSFPEVVDGSAILVDPTEPKFIAQGTLDLISKADLRNDIIKKGYENVKRFSWEKCAYSIAKLLNG